jgi:hypothetical protein
MEPLTLAIKALQIFPSIVYQERPRAIVLSPAAVILKNLLVCLYAKNHVKIKIVPVFVVTMESVHWMDAKLKKKLLLLGVNASEKMEYNIISMVDMEHI